MESNNLTYTKLLETNNLIRSAGEETYFLGVTRTVRNPNSSQCRPISCWDI